MPKTNVERAYHRQATIALNAAYRRVGQALVHSENGESTRAAQMACEARADLRRLADAAGIELARR